MKLNIAISKIAAVAAIALLSMLGACQGGEEESGRQSADAQAEFADLSTDDPLIRRIEHERSEGRLSAEEAEVLKSGWYFENRLDYSSYDLPTQGKYVFELELNPESRESLEDLNKSDSWFREMGDSSRSAQYLFWSAGKTELALTACGHDYLGSVSEQVQRDLLPFAVSENEVSRIDNFFQENSVGSSPRVMLTFIQECKRAFPNSRPSREEAEGFARWQALRSFVAGSSSLNPGIFHRNPEQKDSAMTFVFEDKAFEGTTDTTEELSILKGWFSDNGFDEPL